jgi:hypothetical protein
MTVKEIKEEMIGYIDFYGGDLIVFDLIANAKTKQELSNIIDNHKTFMEDTLQNAISHLDTFKRELGL